MALDEMDKAWIAQQIAQSTQYSSRVVGDTPTDANQMVPKKFLNATFFCGAAGGTGADFLPVGWTQSTGGAFTTITHNLGTTAYAVVATPFATGFNRDFTCVIDMKTATEFRVEQILGGSDSATPFFFLLIKNINT